MPLSSAQNDESYGGLVSHTHEGGDRFSWHPASSARQPQFRRRRAPPDPSWSPGLHPLRPMRLARARVTARAGTASIPVTRPTSSPVRRACSTAHRLSRRFHRRSRPLRPHHLLRPSASARGKQAKACRPDGAESGRRAGSCRCSVASRSRDPDGTRWMVDQVVTVHRKQKGGATPRRSGLEVVRHLD
jgi:hypothetical protein